jgi:LysR family glycine cleavage system transcriptional activator
LTSARFLMHSARIPSLNWLRVFDAAARHESFASAGRELNMSAAAVSQQVAALDTYLKRPLFMEILVASSTSKEETVRI